MKTQQLDLFGSLYQEFRIEKKIRLIECFGGIGAQARSLEALGVPFESHRVIEWAVPSIIAYNAIHNHDWADYSKGKTVDELIELTDGISADYNKPMTREQRAKKGEKWLRRVYSCMVANKDTSPDISRVHWDDLGITEREQYTYILTYSFPCQDLSLAGKLAGMKKGSGTRSGLLWEIERILLECKEHDCLPHVLLMENVRGVMADMKSWASWQDSLHKIGYTNYVDILNSKNYGIPQNRERCFMVSILGESGYQFPQAFERKHNLKDFLDSKVDDKCFLSEKMIKGMLSTKFNQYTMDSRDLTNKKIVPCITTRFEGCPSVIKSEIKEIGNYSPSGHNAAKVVDAGGCCPTVMENHGTVTAVAIPDEIKDARLVIKDATKTGYRLAKDGDGIDIGGRMSMHRGTVQDGMCQTLRTSGTDCGVVVNVDDDAPKVIGGFGNKCNGNRQYHCQNRIYDSDKVATAVTAEQAFHPYYGGTLKIRKLTPCECLRLMGFTLDDYNNLVNAGQSMSQIYHEAGDSIVVTVLMGLFGTMICRDYEEKQKQWAEICSKGME